MKKTRLWILLLAVIALVVRWAQGTKDKLGTGLDCIKDTVEGAADAVVDGADAVVDWAADLVDDTADAVVDGADAVVNWAADAVEGAADAVVDWADAVVDWAADLVEDTADTVVDWTAENEEEDTANPLGDIFADDQVSINLKESSVQWEWRSWPKSHNGTIDIVSAELSITDGEISWGSFVMDMTSITATDIDSESLDDHLKAEDYFDSANYPTSRLTITWVDGNTITADLTIKWITEPVTFEVERTDNSASTTFSFDSTKYWVNEWWIEDALVSDNVDLSIELVY